jgi:fibronectin-binding autotransporter adhesin
MAQLNALATAYEIGGHQIQVMPIPVVMTTNPGPSIGAVQGQLVINPVNSSVWALISGTGTLNTANWQLLTNAGGGPGDFTTLHASGAVTFDTTLQVTGASNLAGGTTSAVGYAATGAGTVSTVNGNIFTTGTGDIASATTITAGTGITATTGNITATLGNVISTAGGVSSGAAIIGGAPAAGVTAFDNGTNLTIGAGTNVVKSTGAGANNSAGYLRFYTGGAIVWVPFFANGAV